LKKQIVNYYTCTKNFKDKFVEEVKHITERLDEEKDRAEMKAYVSQPLRETKSKSIEKVEPKEVKRKKSKKHGMEG
jgi:hypothetical protein